MTGQNRRIGFDSIPIIDVAPLRGRSAAARAAVDAALGAACRDVGFFLITGHSAEPGALARRQQRLLRFFDLAAEAKRRLARRRYEPANRNVYRGYYHPLDRMPSYKEGIDLGVERDRPSAAAKDDILNEPNVWPEETSLPGWRAAMCAYAAEMEDLGFLLLHAIARHLGLEEAWFDAAFGQGASTLRLLHYPPRTPESVAGVEEATLCVHHGLKRTIMTAAHTDSGCLTLLYQDRVGGLQVRNTAGHWIDVPPREHALVVNLGDLMQRWTGGAFLATQHRVLGDDLGSRIPRFSIPFFFEPALDAIIRPIPGLAADAELAAAPIRYGDYLLAKIQRFTEFRDLLTPVRS
ncbi:MAG: isopenicillin N synthase family oxygenase [Proteobacteria bacterium]|nr:isopenicillin N synthase family oxygenase [Pseudomonadota bacterium]MBI3497025.1 isopenicillin N synthase family oxygenase [Pseudomonadota bacterium]